MSAFIRPDLQEFSAYRSHAATIAPKHADPIDQLDTNESSYDLPAPLKAKLAQEYQVSLAANRYPNGDHGALKRAIAAYATTSGHLDSPTVTTEHITVGKDRKSVV